MQWETPKHKSKQWYSKAKLRGMMTKLSTVSIYWQSHDHACHLLQCILHGYMWPSTQRQCLCCLRKCPKEKRKGKERVSNSHRVMHVMKYRKGKGKDCSMGWCPSQCMKSLTQTHKTGVLIQVKVLKWCWCSTNGGCNDRFAWSNPKTCIIHG